jgi:uncharacterized RDD family membrane protein YckC
VTRTNTLLIKTPEGVVFSQTLAGPVARFLAWLVDFMCAAVVMIALNIIVAFTSIVSPELGSALSIIFYFVVSIGYAMTLEWLWRGQTFGKRLLRLRVVDATGLRLQFSQVAIRNLLRVIDLLPGMYLVGGVAALLSRKAQRLGDLAANTVVIRIPRISEPNLEQLGADKYNSLRAHPHLCARLRQRVSPAEASTALQAIIRRDEFEAVARVRLFADLAEHFKSKVEFPADAVEGIADEQYVRNVTDVLYRTETKRATNSLANERQQDAGGTLTPA